jgi:hypothetical protein
MNVRARHVVALSALLSLSLLVLTAITLYLAETHPELENRESGARVGRFSHVDIFRAIGRDAFYAHLDVSESALSGDSLSDLGVPLVGRLRNLRIQPGDRIDVNSIGFPFRCALMVRIYNSGNLMEQHGRVDIRFWVLHFIIPSDPHFGWLFLNFMSILISCSAFALVLWLVVDRAIRASRLRRGACRWCGYAGVPKFHKCPECGR